MNLKLAIVFLMSTSSYVSCSSQEFTSGEGRMKIAAKKCSPTATKKCDDAIVDPLPPEKTNPPAPIKLHEAVFAVRNLSCALCHAKVDSNIITDFAKDTGEASAEQSFRNIFYVTSYGESLKNPPTINGKFIIPTAQTSLLTSLTKGNIANCGFEQSYIKTGFSKVSIGDSLVVCAENKFKWGAGSEKFVGKSKVEINPVSSPDEIKSLADQSILNASGAAPIADAKVRGITGSNATGFKAASAVTCEGAIVFDGPVLLKDTIITTQKGCRIYSTASIFVFGSLTVEGPEESANLQLLSPLYVGFDVSTAVMNSRVNHGFLNKQVFSRGTASQVSALIAADLLKLGGSGLAGNGTASYKKVAASAPIVYAKTSGQFSGVIIACRRRDGTRAD